MPTTREMNRLTEGWPDDGADAFDLRAFAGQLRADRPELSAPALDRVGDRVRRELDRRHPAATPAVGGDAAARWPQRLATSIRSRVVSLPLRHPVPLAAAAAAVVLGVGLWFNAQRAPTSEGIVGERPAPSMRGTVVHEPAAPELAPHERAVVPVVD